MFAQPLTTRTLDAIGERWQRKRLETSSDVCSV